MIKIHTVEQCPHTTTGQGVMHIAHPILTILAGAVQDDIEWLAILTGTRSEDGMEVTVTGIDIPEQDRSYGACSLVHNEPLAPNVVGVVHSHHSMGAFFSQTDDTTLNTRFPTSIVIAQLRGNSSDTETMLGFNYKVEGRAMLPCGSSGVIQFTVLPSPLLPDWPVNVQAGFVEPNTTVTLRHCSNKAVTQKGATNICETSCGIQTTSPVEYIFGKDAKEFMQQVNKQTRKRGMVYQPNQHQGKGNAYHPRDFKHTQYDRYFDDERYSHVGNEAFLRHWGCGD